MTDFKRIDAAADADEVDAVRAQEIFVEIAEVAQDRVKRSSLVTTTPSIPPS
jgi:hypothetical protein